MIYQRQNDGEGEGGHLFRDVEEIRGEIRTLRERINEVNRGFNVRRLLLDLIFSEETSPAETAAKVRRLFCEAESASAQLRELLDTLEDLKEELSEAKRAVYAVL